MPGQRQFRDPVKLREYYRGKSGGLSDSEFDVLFARRIENHARHAACNYRGLLDLAAGGRSRSQAMMTRRPIT
jgi:alpha-D-ribose 1-methylphosphonate 5-triphosphate diphosphatase